MKQHTYPCSDAAAVGRAAVGRVHTFEPFCHNRCDTAPDPATAPCVCARSLQLAARLGWLVLKKGTAPTAVDQRQMVALVD